MLIKFIQKRFLSLRYCSVGPKPRIDFGLLDQSLGPPSGKESGNESRINLRFLIALSGGLLLGFYLFMDNMNSIVRTERISIPAGHVGVIETNGIVSKKCVEPGIHSITRPFRGFTQCHTFDIRTKLLHLIVEVPSKEGLNVTVEVAALYHLDPNAAPQMFESVGINYEGIVVQPQFRAAIKQVCTGFDSKDFYNADTLQQITKQLNDMLSSLTDKRGIKVEEVVLKRITLPSMVQDAIEQKLKCEQEMQQMEFILQKEKAEAERKAIEAQGVADFQRIVSQGISEELLLWKGIEATERLSTSQNTKVVIVGAGEHGLPIILGAETNTKKKKVKEKRKNLIQNLW